MPAFLPCPLMLTSFRPCLCCLSLNATSVLLIAEYSTITSSQHFDQLLVYFFFVECFIVKFRWQKEVCRVFSPNTETTTPLSAPPTRERIFFTIIEPLTTPNHAKSTVGVRAFAPCGSGQMWNDFYYTEYVDCLKNPHFSAYTPVSHQPTLWRPLIFSEACWLLFF